MGYQQRSKMPIANKNGVNSFCLSLFSGTFLLIFCFGLCPSARAESPDDIIVFVNKALKVDAVSQDEVKKIFLKKKTSWSPREKIICIHAKKGTPLRNAFRKRVLEMDEKAENVYWQEQKIRHQLAKPPEFANTVKAVFKVKAIFKTLGAISYAFRKDVPGNVVKTVLVVPSQ